MNEHTHRIHQSPDKRHQGLHDARGMEPEHNHDRDIGCLHHDHSHHHGHHHAHMPDNKKGLARALLITGGIMLLEFFGGIWSGSLALLADSAHMLSDVVAIGLSLLAMWYAAKPASPRKTYGFYRFEIIAALFNGMTLFVIAGFIVKEAYHRLITPSPVESGTMMWIAAVGLFANVMSAWFLMRQSDVKGNVNVRSAYLHILSDALGSVGVLLAGLLMSLFSWYLADPIISVIVALLVLKSAWGVIQHTLHILMEGTPAAVDADKVMQALNAVDGVINVHDLHIWTITSGLDSLSCHLVIEDSADSQTVLQQAIYTVEHQFNIRHATIQVEKSDLYHSELKV
jgi:cobalt-zinc-cadmium efflux system protein